MRMCKYSGVENRGVCARSVTVLSHMCTFSQFGLVMISSAVEVTFAMSGLLGFRFDR